MPPSDRVPLAPVLAVLGERGLEQRAVLWRLDDVAHVPAEVGCQLRGRRHADELARRVPAEAQGREVFRRQLALAVPGRHHEHEPVYLATLHGLEPVGNEPMMRRGLVPGIVVLSEPDQARPRLPAAQEFRRGC